MSIVDTVAARNDELVTGSEIREAFFGHSNTGAAKGAVVMWLDSASVEELDLLVTEGHVDKLGRFEALPRILFSEHPCVIWAGEQLRDRP